MPTPPTAISSVSFGNTARHALNAAAGIISAGNNFRPSAPALRAANPSDGVITPGAVEKSRPLRRPHDIAIEVRRDNEPTAGRRDSSDVGDIDDRAGSDQRMRPIPSGQPLDAIERIRRVERHLDDDDPRLDERIADRRRPSSGCDASQGSR